jgi:Zn-dependent protease/predicted transcriptional regulator
VKGSFRIATLAGIGVFVHWTFFILLAWIAMSHVAEGDDFAKVAEGVGFIVALFGCIVLHELGHALTARQFGVKTRDITLLPIGGVARLERIPERPLHEFLVAVAGPAVNLVIAGLLLIPISLAGRLGQSLEVTVVGGDFLTKLMWVNVGLVIFNMLPAFPMDGGRVLRALLAARMSRVRATHKAAAVGQMMAILFGILGVLGGQWMLLLIAFVIYQGAQAESAAVELRALFHGVRVRDVMITRFQTLSEDDPVELALAASSQGLQKDFPVTHHHKIRGVLQYHDLVNAMKGGTAGVRVSDIVRRECPIVSENEPLNRALEKMHAAECSTLLVVRGDELVGMLSEEHLGQWVRLHASLIDRE